MRARCLAVIVLTFAGTASADPGYRIGIDGSASIGFLYTAGGELRGEVPVGGRHVLTLRAEWLKYHSLLNEEGEEVGPSPAWNLFGGYLGERAYWDNLYFEIALGVAIAQRDDYTDNTGERLHSETASIPGIRLGFGGKAGGLDAGLELMFPAGLGIHLGIDFARW
jgi:hypothetical protein